MVLGLDGDVLPDTGSTGLRAGLESEGGGGSGLLRDFNGLCLWIQLLIGLGGSIAFVRSDGTVAQIGCCV